MRKEQQKILLVDDDQARRTRFLASLGGRYPSVELTRADDLISGLNRKDGVTLVLLCLDALPLLW